MANEFSVFNFKTESELLSKMQELSVELPFEENVDILKNEVEVGEKMLKNSLVVPPMEGCDCNEDGSPSDLVYRRDERFAKGGSGMLWMEACAVSMDGRATPPTDAYK